MSYLNNKYLATFLFGFLFLMLGFIPVQAQVDLGGELKTVITAYELDNDWESSLEEQMELELFLPRLEETEFVVRLMANWREGQGAEIDIKKLYLERNLGPFNLKAGRQPISWSFGSLVNPADYNLGAEALEQETMLKYADGIELYYPINWNSGLAMLVTDLANNDQAKYGLRARTMLAGYDLTVNYVDEPGLDRYGFTTKGDLGPIGIYGAVSHLNYNKQLDEKIYLVGGDYSYNFLAGEKLSFQLEYLKSDGFNDLTSLLGGSNVSQGTLQNLSELEMIIGQISYQPDQFSSFSLFAVNNTNDGSWILLPIYNYLLSSNWNLKLQANLLTGDEDELFGGNAKGVQASFSYAF